ncbi:MAG TPA: ABC transporter substrate-binding protein [Acetobacteraceae bacterium]|nr:ABC transporter substrate-binding protein [Acetobacteraceae bacterium]
MKRRTVFRLGGAAAAVTALPRFAIGQSASATTLKFVPQANLTSLDPIWTTASVTENHAYAVYDTLYATDSKLVPKPQMAEGHTISEDGRTYLIKLREGLKFHDGEPVRAQDVAPSLARWSARDTLGQTVAKFVDTWGVQDDKTVKITLKSPFPLLIDALAKPAANEPFIMPERLAKTDPMQQIKETIGSGPFRFLPKEFVAGSSAAYEKFEGYVPRQEPPDWASGGKVAYFKRVEWKIIPDAATASAALQSGEVDWWEQVQADLVPLLKRSKNLTIGLSNPTGYLGVMRFNNLNPPFNDPRMRRAVLMAVNQDDYMRAVTGNDTSAFKDCKALFPCGTPFGTQIGAPLMKGDLEAGKKLLKEAGYAGQKVVIINPTDFPSIGPFGDVTYDLLKKLGMNVELQDSDWGTVVQRRASKKPLSEGGWSIFHTWWPGDSILNPVVSAILRGQGDKGWFGWFSDEKIEQLTNQFLTAKDQAAQLKLTDEIQQEAFQQAPTIPLGLFYIRSAYSSTLTHMLQSQAPFFWSVRRG